MSKAIERFLDAATVLGHPVDVRRFPEGTKTAPDAARAIGCEVGQIVKSLVFVADGDPVLALTSGANRVDVGRLATLAGASEARRANPEEARAAAARAVAAFTLWKPPGWHTSDGLALGESEARITEVYGALTRVECGGYSALKMRKGGAITVFYVFEGALWGFGLTRPDVLVCR